MALQVSSDGQLVFFNKVFGPWSAEAGLAKTLVSAGVKFEVSLYAVQAAFFASDTGLKKLSGVTLTTGSTALIKGTVPATVLIQNKKLIATWLDTVNVAAGFPVAQPKVGQAFEVVLVGVQPSTSSILPLIKAVQKVSGWTLLLSKNAVQDAAADVPQVISGVYSLFADATHAAEALKKVGGVVEVKQAVTKAASKPAPATPQHAPQEAPVDAVIDLKAAQALGQKVHGTSTGSVYHCIALTEHVKLAARILPGSISIRTEWTDAPSADLQRLEEAGMLMHAHYGSIHFSPQNVPVSRVIGAFLVGCGISWKAAVMSGDDLVLGGQ